MHRRTTENLDVELINQKNETLTIWTALKNKKSKNLSFKLSDASKQSYARYSKSSLKARSVSLIQNVTNKKDRLGNLSITWIIRVGATGFEPAN